MRVALDARMIGHSGIGTAIRGWLEGMAGLSAEERPRMILLGREDLLKRHADSLQAEIVPFDAPVYSLREQLLFPRCSGRWDLLHVPHYAHPVFYSGPMLCTVHDRFHLKYGSPARRLYQRFMLNRLKANERSIATVSGHVREELISIEGFEPSRVITVPHGLTVDGACLPSPAKRTGDYLLWVGILQPHKNLRRLLGALVYLDQRKQLDFPVLLAGIAPKDVGRLRAMVRERNLGRAVSILPRFDESEKASIFSSARAFVFPSIDEGFGFPPLEAMSHGIPCTVSNCPPMNETCEHAALFFDPYEEEEIAQAVNRIMHDEALRKDLCAKGMEHVKRFDWRESARKLIAAYEAALSLQPEATAR